MSVNKSSPSPGFWLSEGLVKKRYRGKVRVHVGFRVTLQTENDETG